MHTSAAEKGGETEQITHAGRPSAPVGWSFLGGCARGCYGLSSAVTTWLVSLLLWQLVPHEWFGRSVLWVSPS